MGVELNFWEKTNKRIIELNSSKKLIKRVRFKWLKITRQGGRIERLKIIRVKRKKNKREILGKKKKLERFENGKYCSGGTVNKIKI